MSALQLAYLANILILVPIAIPTLFRWFPTDESAFEESTGWRVIVGSFWLAILLLSGLGLRDPLKFSPVLILQLIYKTMWLLVYAGPQVWRGQIATLPWGITLSFLAIVLAWPWIIPWSYLFDN